MLTGGSYPFTFFETSPLNIGQINSNETNHISSIEAPTAVAVVPKSTTSVNVIMTIDEPNTDVSFYEAGYQRKFCSVDSSVSPRSCSIGDLSAGTSYRVYAMACMASYECSHRKLAEGFTFPDGKEKFVCHFFQYFAFILFAILSPM